MYRRSKISTERARLTLGFFCMKGGNMATPTLEITMKREKDCKHSIRYKSEDPDAILPTAYLKRKDLGSPPPEKIKVVLKLK